VYTEELKLLTGTGRNSLLMDWVLASQSGSTSAFENLTYLLAASWDPSYVVLVQTGDTCAVTCRL